MLKKSFQIMCVLMLAVGALFSSACAQELSLPVQLTSISEEAFMGSSVFESAVLPDGLKRIESKAFADCTGLKVVYMPSSVEYIAPDAFDGCGELVFVCEEESYAAGYAQGYAAISVIQPQKIPVALSANVLMAEKNTPITWTVNPSQLLAGDRYTLTIYLDGNVYAVHTGLDPAQTPSVTETLSGKTGLVYALCTYTHVHGETTQVLSETTQLAGEMTASLNCADPLAYLDEHPMWELTVQGAAGIPMAEFTVIQDGVQTTTFAPQNTTSFQIWAQESGVYRVDAVITDGLGRSISVTGNEVTVLDETAYGQEISYRLASDENGYIVENCPMDAYSVTIPDERNGVPVIAVADGAFMLCDQLGTVVIGKNVKTIGDYAFHGCSNLYSVSLPDTLSEIGEGAFSACSGLGTLALPSALKAVPDYMAEGSGLTEITLPANVTKVGQRAFADCSRLTSAALNEGLNSLGSNAFENCTALSSIAFPQSLTALGTEAFSGCSGLEELSIPQTLSAIGERTFGGCTGLQDLVLPAGVSSVGASAFAGCENLNTVTFENINASIGQDAFAYCGDVEVRTFGADSIQRQLEQMGVAFRNTAMVVLTRVECLTSYPRAESVLMWQVEAEWGVAPYTFTYELFWGDKPQFCIENTSDAFFQYIPVRGGEYFLRVTVSDSNGCVITRDSAPVAVADVEGATLEYLTYELNSAGDGYVITKISNLPANPARVVIPDAIDGIPVVQIKYNAIPSKEYIGEVVIGDNITAIEQNTFRSCVNLKTVVLGSGVQTIGGYAFSLCDNLETIHLPYGLQEISKYAFEECPKLKDVILPTSVTTLGEYAFRYCSSLTDMTVPDSVTSCGTGLFEGCTELETVDWNATLNWVPYHTFQGCTNLDTVTIGYPIGTIGGYSFRNSGLRSLEGNLSAVEVVQDEAFRNCTRLTSLELPAKVTYMRFGERSMMGCTNLMYLTLDEETILSAPEKAFMDCWRLSSIFCKNLRPVGSYAFANCRSLGVVTLECTSLNAFEGCSSLKKVNLIGGIYVNPYCFRNCTSLNSVTYLKEWNDKEITFYGIHVGHHAFQNCTSLGGFSTPSPSNLDIDAYAFENCTSLTHVTLPPGRGGSHVGEGAFKNCTALSGVSNVRHVTSIGAKAFQNCVSLSSISFAPVENEVGSTLNNIKIGEEAFANCRSLGHVSFDEGTVEIGVNAFAGCDNLSVTATPGSYAESYFAGGALGSPSAVTLPLSLSAEVKWGKSNLNDGTVEATVTLWNTKDGPSPAAGGDLYANSVTQNLAVTLGTSSRYWHTVELAEGSTLPVSIPYRESVAVKVKVKCVRPDPSVCPHHEHSLTVKMTANGCDDYSVSFPIEASFPQTYESDWYITEPTVITSRTEVGGNVYVQNELVIQGTTLSCAQNVYVQKGGTVKMESSAAINTLGMEIQSGGGLDMLGGSRIQAESLSNAGALNISTAAVKITADDFSVIGSGVLNFAADGRITADSFTFNTSGSHAALLTNGVIIARTANLRQGFHASGKQAFILQGDECTLNVSRTSPKQRFAGLTIDCKVEGLSVEGAGSLFGLPFECDHFVMTESTLQEDLVNSNTLAKEIYDKATAARLEAMTEAEKELSHAMAGWYDVTPNLAQSSIQNYKEMAVPAAYAQKAILGWVVEIAAGMPDAWSSVNDVLRSLLASGTHGTYTFEDKGVVYEAYVKPVGGLTIGSAAMTVGQITVTTGDKTYEFTYSLNKTGIRQSGDLLLKVIRDYGRDEYVNAMNKAIEEAMGKESAKYALGVVKVIETSLVEERSLLNVIAGKYGKSVAKELISQKYPKMKKLIQFYTKWDKYISQNQKIESMISDVRNGEELPTDLMKEFLKLPKVVP